MAIEKITLSDVDDDKLYEASYKKSGFHAFLTIIYCNYADDQSKITPTDVCEFANWLKDVFNHSNDDVVQLTITCTLLAIQEYLETGNKLQFLNRISNSLDLLDDED